MLCIGQELRTDDTGRMTPDGWHRMDDTGWITMTARPIEDPTLTAMVSAACGPDSRRSPMSQSSGDALNGHAKARLLRRAMTSRR